MKRRPSPDGCRVLLNSALSFKRDKDAQIRRQWKGSDVEITGICNRFAFPKCIQSVSAKVTVVDPLTQVGFFFFAIAAEQEEC